MTSTDHGLATGERAAPPKGGADPCLTITGARGLAAARALARELRDRARPALLVTADPGAAESLERDLRLLLGSAGRIRNLPFEDSTPYSTASPSLEVTGERLGILLGLADGEMPDLLLCSAPALMRRTLEWERLVDASVHLHPGDSIGRESLSLALLRAGYARVPLVEDPATFSVRGSLVDVYPPGARLPLRIDLFGDDVDTIRQFDPSNQRSGEALPAISIPPVREVLFDPDAVACALDRLREQADAQDFPTRKLNTVLHDVENGVPFFGVEGLAPAFSPQPRPALLQLLEAMLAPPYELVLVEPTAVAEALDSAWKELAEGFDDACGRGRLAFAPHWHALGASEAQSWLDARATLRIDALGLDCRGTCRAEVSSDTDDLRQEIEQIARQASDSDETPDLFAPVRGRLNRLRRDGVVTLILVQGRGGLQRLRDLLSDHHMESRVLEALPDLLDPTVASSLYQASVHAHLVAVPSLPSGGAVFPHLRLAIFSEEDFFGRRSRRRTTATKTPFRTTLGDLEDGDIVVHVDFGVGVYHGLTRLNVRGVEADYLLITYRDDDKLYLPVTRINLVQRYSGAEGHRPRLDKLGGQTWNKTRARVKQALLAMAQELLAIYARREVVSGVTYPAPDAMYREFEGRFGFEETPDQARAITDVLADLQRDRPMDRLVCGDVGYGKTEVAMRAAMLVALGGRQVAILAPTTVLAQQHYLTLCERFAGMPVRVDVISRLRRSAEVLQVLERARQGQLDILVGTHRLLQHDVGFKNLGLLVVDEEHRFGVKDKERIKALRANVDVLSLSATPIPRTLQMAFFGLRDLSIIMTPPADRRAIRTAVSRFDQNLIRDAIQRELRRGGQVYVVHNRVQSIAAFAEFLRRLVPEARVGVAHGQMAPGPLEQVMLGFIRGELNVLVSTTIIESGLDIPRANTMIVNRADQLGLAQLYQLRGRIGRSHERAYAYLLVPPSSERMTPKARKRLEVLQRFAELGAGFKIAQHDLELRGAGDLLGKSQHGHVAAVGYEMYAELLAEAVQELQGRDVDLAPEPELNVHVAAFIPEDYVVDVHERLAFYQRMATALETSDVYEVQGALEDRYGPAPDEVRTLCEVMVLKVLLKSLAARAIDLMAPREGSHDPARVVVALADSVRLDPARIAAWVAEQPARLRLTPQMKLVLTASDADWLAAGQDIVDLARRFLNETLQRAGVPAKTAGTRSG
ncbi:MAG: transcription-repair coupling factor [Pseudomonadota bacterium]